MDFEGAQNINKALNYKTADHMTFAKKLFSEGPDISDGENDEAMGTI